MKNVTLRPKSPNRKLPFTDSLQPPDKVCKGNDEIATFHS